MPCRYCFYGLLLATAGSVWCGVASSVERESPATGREPVHSTASTVDREDSRDSAESANGRLREGSKLLDEMGEFQKAGERIVFFLQDDNGSMRVLENLALERVVRALEDNPSLRTWSVSGEVTEFRGENYLMLTRAVLKTRSEASSSSSRRTPKLKFGEK